MDKSEIINNVKIYANLLKKHLEVDQVILFGSFAKETERQDSDIDIAVVIDHINDDYLSMVSLLWNLRRQIDLRIEPHLIIKDKDYSGFLNEIQNTGIIIS